MGLFSKLLGKDVTQEIILKSPLHGNMVDVANIPDPTFAESILGPTLCIDPSEGIVYSPCDGVVSQIFRTAHAVTITSKDGVEILIHVGINTVDLKGEGFQALVKDDDTVTAGQPLIEFDKEVIHKANLSSLVPVVICNAMDFDKVDLLTDGLPKAVDLDSHIIKVTPKK